MAPALGFLFLAISGAVPYPNMRIRQAKQKAAQRDRTATQT